METLKMILKLLWIEFARLFVVAFSAVFCLFPAIFCLMNFAFVDLICIENPLLDTKAVFLLSKELALGNGRKIFLLQLSSFGNACAVGILMLCVLLTINKFLPIRTEFFFVFVPIAVLVAMFSFSKINLSSAFFQSRNDKILQFRR